MNELATMVQHKIPIKVIVYHMLLIQMVLGMPIRIK